MYAPTHPFVYWTTISRRGFKAMMNSFFHELLGSGVQELHIHRSKEILEENRRALSASARGPPLYKRRLAPKCLSTLGGNSVKSNNHLREAPCYLPLNLRKGREKKKEDGYQSLYPSRGQIKAISPRLLEPLVKIPAHKARRVWSGWRLTHAVRISMNMITGKTLIPASSW